MAASPIPFRSDKGVSVEIRLLLSGKRLFSQQGFERTTTSAIARDAGTSESQLLKYFGSKEGLLAAIFTAGWERVSYVFAASSVSSSPAEALRMLFELLIKGFQEDKELRDLMLLEGRRIRAGTEVSLSAGYLRLYDEIGRLVSQLTTQSAVTEHIRPKAIASGLLGMLEAMLRDQVVAERKGDAQDGPTADEMRVMFRLIVQSLVAGLSPIKRDAH